MGDIGSDPREVEYEPFETPAIPEPAPVPTPQPQEVPA